MQSQPSSRFNHGYYFKKKLPIWNDSSCLLQIFPSASLWASYSRIQNKVDRRASDDKASSCTSVNHRVGFGRTTLMLSRYSPDVPTMLFGYLTPRDETVAWEPAIITTNLNQRVLKGWKNFLLMVEESRLLMLVRGRSENYRAHFVSNRSSRLPSGIIEAWPSLARSGDVSKNKPLKREQ